MSCNDGPQKEEELRAVAVIGADRVPGPEERVRGLHLLYPVRQMLTRRTTVQRAVDCALHEAANARKTDRARPALSPTGRQQVSSRRLSPRAGDRTSWPPREKAIAGGPTRKGAPPHARQSLE